MKSTLIQKIILFSILIILVNSLLGYSIYKNHQKDDDAYQLLKISEKVIEHSNLILSQIKDVETSARGYVITQDRVFLEPFNRAKSKMLVSLDKLKLLTHDNPSQRQRVDSLGSYVYKRLDVSSRMIELRNKEGLSVAVDYVSSRIGKNYTDSIRKITDYINQEEGFMLQQQQTLYEHDKTLNDRFSVTLFLLMSFFTILILIATINYLCQNQSKVLRASELILINAALVFQNEEKEKRTEELFLANAELAYQNEEKEKRTAELLIANQELSTTKNYLKDYIKGLEEMIVMTSHKVRQPIANILGLADVLHHSLNSPLELKQIIVYVKESAVKLDIFTKELTVFMINLNQKKE